MEYGTLLTDSKWNIIKELSKENQTPTDLAKKTNTSVANIGQQLRLLEAYGLVKKEKKINSRKPGKPKMLFSLDKELTHLTIINKQLAVKKELELDFFQQAILNLWVTQKKENPYYLEKFLIINEEIVNKCQAIGIVKTDETSTDLLLVTERIDEIRAKYSNQTIDNLEGYKKKIVCWTHTMKEIEEGLKSHNEHFMWLMKNLKPFMDKEEFITTLLELKNGKNN
ncbi:MAG: winged helix-turn-helix domain-containing protein [archaeon]